MKSIKFFSVLLLAGLLSVGVVGCANKATKKSIADADIVSLSYKAADELMSQSSGSVDMGKAIVAASFVNINNLNDSSSFGRIAAQQLSSRFTQKGYTVAEMLLRNNIYIKERSGEFLLSRALRNISAAHDAQAVIVGTYAVASANVYVTAKIVRISDSAVLSSHDYVLPLGPDMRSLTRK